ncbi:MAG: PIN domain-containing protein [Syntrophaceae bacterium]|nr:PIN domain-containing protein [Syntrophaceae bacterium]
MIPFLKGLRHKKIALDTMIFIYAFEEHRVYLPLVHPLFRELEKGKLTAVTSTLTIAECMVQPFRAKALELAARYKILFRDFPHLSVIPVSDEIAEKGAWLRAQYKIKTPDAIQLATALITGSHVFLTNDEALPSIEGIRVLILDRFLK